MIVLVSNGFQARHFRFVVVASMPNVSRSSLTHLTLYSFGYWYRKAAEVARQTELARKAI